MYRESSRMATAIAVGVWVINMTASAVAIVLLAALLRGAGTTWMPEISFWQAVLLRVAFRLLSSDTIKVTLRD